MFPSGRCAYAGEYFIRGRGFNTQELASQGRLAARLLMCPSFLPLLTTGIFDLIMAFMKNIIFLVILICLCNIVFAQNGLDLSLGFQYGTARVKDNGETLRKITEPGVVLTLRMVPDAIGLFTHVGLLFPSKVTEGDVTLSYSNYNYILFLNGAIGVGFKMPINERLDFHLDAGISINDLLYGGSFKDTIDASWTIKLENLGTTYSGGHKYENIKMKESYNDVSFGILGNMALKLKFTRSLFMMAGMAASFDFLRMRSYKFYADFTSLPLEYQKYALGDFPHDKLKIADEGKANERATELTLESDNQGSVFKQFTFIPSISIGFSF